MNEVKAIVQLLQTELAATAPSGDTLHQRIAMDRMPPTFKNAASAIQVQSQAGAQIGMLPATRFQIVIKCYGGTSDYDACSTVSRRVFSALHYAIEDPSEAGVMFAERATTSRYYEPDTGWPVVLDVYEIELLERT